MMVGAWLIAVALSTEGNSDGEWEKLQTRTAAAKPIIRAPLVFDYMQHATPSDAHLPMAEFQLATALEELGLRAAATAYFAKLVSDRMDPEVVPQALTQLLRLFEQPHDLNLEMLVFSTLDLGALPAPLQRRAHLEQGLVDLNGGREAWAKSHFDQLPQDSRESAEARFTQLVLLVKRGDPAKRLVPQFQQLLLHPALPKKTKLESQLAVARLQFEYGDVQSAAQNYQNAELAPLDPGRAALYLEEAWAEYSLGHDEATLALLVALDAPSFRGAFLPDKYLLRAQILLSKCHYLPARRAARELLRTYSGALDAIAQRRDLAEVTVLRDAALAKPRVAQAEALVLNTQKEIDALDRLHPRLGDALYDSLARVYGTALAEAIRSRDQRLSRSLEVEADKLLAAAEQVRVLEYEVGLQLHARLSSRGELTDTKAVRFAEVPTAVSYEFTGEYWNDELRDVQTETPSRCDEDRDSL
jgi:hypothetical protein